MNRNHREDNFFIDRWKSLGYAFRGFYLLIRQERAIQIHVFLSIIFLVLGFVFKISTLEWISQLLAIGLVLSIEGLNTAIEELCDFVHADFHQKIGKVKDLSAGAVTFAAISAYISLSSIYIIRILDLLEL